MYRKAMAISICCAALVLGCEKKEAGKEAPPVVTRIPLKAPAGMVQLRQGASVFIDQKPLAVGEYTAYLEATGQPVPEKWQGIEPGTLTATAPVLGLTRQQADWCAAYVMKRVPTRQEWQQAAMVVGSRPYPWPEDAAEDVAGGEIFLIRDWVRGSDGEKTARDLKADLPQTILAQYRAEVEHLAGQLGEVVEGSAARQQELWKGLKPAFFALLEKKRSAAELRARQDALSDVLDILRQMARDKAQVAVELKTGDLTKEQADAEVQSYEQGLADVRAKVQEVRQNLQERTRTLQDEIVAVTQRFETTAGGKSPALAAAEQALARASAPPQTVGEAISLGNALGAALDRMADVGPALAGLPALEEVNEEAGALDAEIKQLSADDRLSREVEDLRKKIAALDETIQREFLQEKLLLGELDELANMRARMKGVEAKLAGLQQALAGLSAP